MSKLSRSLLDVINDSDYCSEWNSALAAATKGPDPMRTRDDARIDFKALMELDVTSPCGKQCAAAIMRTDAFLDHADVDALESQDIKGVINAVAHSITVWYFG